MMYRDSDELKDARLEVWNLSDQKKILQWLNPDSKN